MKSIENAASHSNESDVSEIVPKQAEVPQPADGVESMRPQRARKKAAYLQDFETEEKMDKLQTGIDFCYRDVCDIPQTYKDVIASINSR